MMCFGLCECVVGNGRGYMKVKRSGAPVSQDAVQREGEEEHLNEKNYVCTRTRGDGKELTNRT